jgi:hypothetical protein
LNWFALIGAAFAIWWGFIVATGASNVFKSWGLGRLASSAVAMLLARFSELGLMVVGVVILIHELNPD